MPLPRKRATSPAMTGAQCDQAFMVFVKKLQVYTRFIIKAFLESSWDTIFIRFW